MQELVIFQVNADMAATAEEDQITGLQVGLADLPASINQLASGSGQGNAEQTIEGLLHKGRTINPAAALTTVTVGRALPLPVLLVKALQGLRFIQRGRDMGCRFGAAATS